MGENINYPKTLLKGDIRDYTTKTYRIIAILSKNKNEQLYRKINYIGKNIKIDRILIDKELRNKIDVDFLNNIK